MAFNNEKPIERGERFDLGNANDRRIINEFEEELAPYEARKVTVLRGNGSFERELSGFNLYLHEQGIFQYTTVYPLGMFVIDELPTYRFLKLKMQALESLRESRKRAVEHESERAESLVAQGV